MAMERPQLRVWGPTTRVSDVEFFLVIIVQTLGPSNYKFPKQFSNSRDKLSDIEPILD